MKKIKIVLYLLSFTMVNMVTAQKYFTKGAMVSFYSSSPLEKIEGVTKSANCVVDQATGAVEMAVLIKSLIFAKALMQEHFNENYMESNTYPKATFKGVITNIADVKLNSIGSYTAMLKGNITIHGVTKPLETSATIKSDGIKIGVTTEFNLTVADYNISIPSVVKDNIAKVVKVTIKADLEELKKAQ